MDDEVQGSQYVLVRTKTRVVLEFTDMLGGRAAMNARLQCTVNNARISLPRPDRGVTEPRKSCYASPVRTGEADYAVRSELALVLWRKVLQEARKQD